MARFVFKLETVLSQRANAERLAQRNVAVARAALVPLQEQLAALDRQGREAADDMRANRLVGKIDVAFIAGHRRFVVAMERQAMALARQIAEAQAAVDRAQAVLIVAAREHKAIETLRERQLERWTEEQAKRESADLDEAGMQIAFTNLTAARAENPFEETP